MTTDNTTPRLTKELIARHARLETMIARVPIVVRRLDMEQPGFPTGHTSSGIAQDGPDRWQTSDPAYQAVKALHGLHKRLCDTVDEYDRLLANWAVAVKPSSVRDSTSSEHCVPASASAPCPPAIGRRICAAGAPAPSKPSTTEGPSSAYRMCRSCQRCWSTSTRRAAG